MPSLYQAAFRHSVGVKNSYSSCSGFHSTSSNLSWLVNCGTNGARYQWFSSRLFVGRSLSVHMMISELKRMLSGGAIDQWGIQTRLCQAESYKVAAMRIAAFVFSERRRP